MGADRWSRCPQCSKNAVKEKRESLAELEAQYGKIPAEEWMQKMAAVKETSEAPEAMELREDYSFYLDEETGEFSAYYSAVCYKCNWSFKFEHEEKTPLKED